MAQTNAVLLEVPLDIHMKVKRLADDDRLKGKGLTIKEKYIELIKLALGK